MTTVRILSFEDLRSEKGIPYSKVHLWRLERDGKFPKRCRWAKAGTAGSILKLTIGS